MSPEGSELSDINWEEYLSDYANNATQGSMSGGAAGGDWDENRSGIENTLARASSLADHLTWQVRMGGFNELDQEISDILIGNVDEQGYLRLSVEEAAFEAGVETTAVESVLRRVQEFEPSGVFARDLSECLSIQLREAELPAEIRKNALGIVNGHLELLEAKRVDKLARELSLSKDEVAAAVEEIAKL